LQDFDGRMKMFVKRSTTLWIHHNVGL